MIILWLARSEVPAGALLPDMPIDKLGDFLLVFGRIGWLRKSLVDMVEDENFDLGLGLFLFGPMFERGDQAL